MASPLYECSSVRGRAFFVASLLRGGRRGVLLLYRAGVFVHIARYETEHCSRLQIIAPFAELTCLRTGKPFLAKSLVASHFKLPSSRRKTTRAFSPCASFGLRSSTRRWKPNIAIPRYGQPTMAAQKEIKRVLRTGHPLKRSSAPSSVTLITEREG